MHVNIPGLMWRRNWALILATFQHGPPKQDGGQKDRKEKRTYIILFSAQELFFLFLEKCTGVVAPYKD
jgi:hypothetical protein